MMKTCLKFFFSELEIPTPDYNLNVGSGKHGDQTAKMIQGIEKILLKEKPDYITLYGDTNSTLAGAIAASKIHIPIIHIGGGEITEGSVDDSYRHCITKLSSFHLVSNNIYKKRIIQLGENKKNIFVIGNPADEMIYKEK